MSEYAFDLGAFESEGMDDGLREEVVRCSDCLYAREAYWHDGEQKHADSSYRLCGYFGGGEIQVPLAFFCAAGKGKE